MKHIFCVIASTALFYFSSSAQNLTISTAGQTGTSGTNWSITGNTLNVAASGSANIHPDVISNHLNSIGDLTVVLPWQSGVIRQCSIDGAITYTGSATRTLTFLIANDIFMTSPNQSITATGTGALNVVLRAANIGGVPDNGRISIRQNNTINTNGGHLWIGGGSGNVTWNGLTVGNGVARTWSDDVPGLWIENSTLNTNGGNVYLAGLSWNSSANSGVNYGVRMVNSDITSVSGNIEINGELKGRYQIGNGTRIESTTTATSITTTTGSIIIRGTGSDQTTNDNGYRFGAVITGSSSTAKTIISSTSGNIQIEGNANFTATVNDKEGLAIGGSTEIISRSGNITIRGTNSLETSGQYCNSIRFGATNNANSIRVGFDGTNAYTGNILIEGNSIYQRYSHSGTGSIAVQTTGTLTIQPTGNAFTYMRADDAGTLTFDNDWNFGTTLSSFTFGKSTNTTNLTFANVLSTAGPITIYGGNININENLNTSAGASSGNVLIKSSADINLAANKSITTSGASVILWANSDNASSNGSIALRNASSIVTGSNIVAGGHVWLGGGSNGTTWNGLAVGSGYAVPGTSFTPPSGNAADAGIYLERNSITSFGGNIKIAGDAGASGFAAIVTYGNTITINAGSGKIEMDGQVTSAAAGNRGGILFGLHDNQIASTVNLSSSSTSGDAITITGIGRGTEDAIGLSGTVNITASGGGNIVMNGNALGTGRSIVAGNYYHGILNVFANSGNITLNGNTKAVQVATAVINGLTSGPSKINIGQGGSILSSSSNVVLTADNIALAAGGIAVNTSGTVTIEPSSNSFASALTYPISNLSIANTITGLTLGKSTNTANITVSSAQTIAGPITMYGGNITINQNLTSTASGADILVRASGDIVLGAGRTIATTAGDVILWANSDGGTSNGGVFLDAASSITTSGGHVWIGGSSTNGGSTTWNGLTVGNGHATSGRDLTTFQNEGTAIDWDAGVLLDETTINTSGGNIYIAGRRSVSPNSRGGAGVINYSGTNGTLINSGTGTIAILGETSIDVTGSDLGIMTGLHPNNYTGRLTIQSANTSSATAISITASTVTADAGLLVEDHTRILSTATSGGGGISMNLSSGTGSALQVGIGGNSGMLDLLSASGAIAVDGGSDAITVPVTVGTFRIGSISGDANVPSSTANVTLTSNTISLAGTVPIVATGTLTIAPTTGNSFTSTFSTAVLNYTGITGLTIGHTANTAAVTIASVTSIAGPITVFGGVVSADANITTSNASSISLLAKSGLRFSSSGITLQTGGGDVVLSGDHDANSSGNIIAAGALTITTNGGAISIGGGATGSDFAYGIGTSSTIANDQTAGIWVRGAVNINSGNGNISIKGYAANASPTVQHVPSWGVGLGLSAVYNTNPASVTINSGTGTILIEGFARNPSGLNTNSYGVVFNNWETTTTESLTITSANTTANAIRLTGNTENTINGQRTKNSLRFWSLNNNIRATGTGGGITLSGKTFDGNDHPQICWSGGNLLATSGPIIINTENEALEIGNDMYVGSRSGITGNTTSSANVRFSIDDFTVASGIVRVASTGSLTIEPFGSSFTDYTPVTNTIQGFTTASRWSLNENAQTLTGLTVGKPLNASNVTIGSTANIAGPVTVYGGSVNINENINTTSGGSSGDILLKATTDITFAKAKSILSNGGDMIFWSDSDGNGAGDIFFEADQNSSYTNPVTVSTGGGHLWLGGGSGTATWNGLTVGNGYAVGNSARAVGGSFTHYNGIMIQATSINTSGGHVKMRGMGKTGNYSHPSYSGGIYMVGSGTMNSGGGSIDIDAVSQSGNSGNYGLYNLGPYIFSPGSGSLTIFGDASASSASFGGNATGNGVLLWDGAISSTGDINISGKKSSGSATFGVYINVNISTAGANKNITIETDNLNIVGSKTLTSSGQLILKPFVSSTSIGLAGASGTLSLPASYFTTNFTDGFSNIQIGSESQTGAISVNTFTLRDNITFLTSGSLTLGGKPVLGNNDVTLGSAISSINASTSNYFQTTGTGKVNRILANAGSLQFPVGNAAYNPVTITNNSGTSDLFSVRVFDAVYLTGTSGAQLTTPRVNATWDINKQTANAGSGVNFAFTWNNSQEAGTMNQYQLNHFTNSSWELATGTSAVSLGSGIKTLTHSAYTGTFSPFAIGNSSVSALPVTLLSFDVSCEEGKPHFTWITVSEINNSHFDLEQSADLISWGKVARIEGNGNSNELISYEYTLEDFRPSLGHYFRLHQYDYNGDSEAHFSVYLDEECQGAAGLISVFPNPADGPFTVSGALAGSEWQLMDASGRLLDSRKADSAGNIVFANELPDGMYFLRSVLQGETILKKIVIRRMD